MNWDHAIDTVTPHVVKIETPAGYGTGFLALYNHDRSWCGIATAAHVVSHADEWQQPIRLRHDGSMTQAFLKPEERVIFLSGGPVFHYPTPDHVQVIGCVSAYHANRVTGETLPGLLRAQDVSHFHDIVQRVQTIDEANAKKREFEAAQAGKAENDVKNEEPINAEPAAEPPAAELT